MDIYEITAGAKLHNDHPFEKTQRVRVTIDGSNYKQGDQGVVERDHYLNCVKVKLDGGDAGVNIPVTHLEAAGKSSAALKLVACTGK